MRALKYYFTAILIIGLLNVQAQNPIVTNLFTADPAAMVYGDSVYIYTGHDEALSTDNGYVMNDWHVFSSADLVNWHDHGEVLKVSDFSWAGRDAWASHTVERNGKFYWYVTLGPKTGGAFAIGVAVSNSPTGPFTDAIGAPLITDGMTADVMYDIDPAVFIDDDNQAYLYWGNGGVCKAVKLKDNMVEMDGAIINIPVTNFTEAAYMHKRNSIYYLTYASGWPEKIAYSTSNSPLGPFVYKGVLNDFVSSSTNHQAVIEFKNQGYFIYHTGDIGGDYQRSVAIDYLFYNTDGTIKEIVQTQQSVAVLSGTCFPLPVTPNMQLNGGTWSNERIATIREGESIVFSPEADEEGTWSWTGPNNFSENTRIVSLINITAELSGVYSVVFTNSCGVNSYMSFNITVKHGVLASIESGKTYIIIPKGSEMAVSVKNAGINEGAEIVQSTFVNGAHQKWQLTNVDTYYWRLTPENASTMGIDVNNFSQDDNAKIQLWTYWGGTTQQWEIVEKIPNNYQIMARHSSKCLDVESTVTAENARVRQWTCNDSDRQQFTIIEADSYLGISNSKNKPEIVINYTASDSNTIAFDITQFENASVLTIIDINGRKMYKSSNLADGVIQPGLNLKAGIYIVTLEYNKLIYTKKFVVE